MTEPAPVRRKRPARPQFASTVLLLEAFLVLFATLVAFGLAVAARTGLSTGTVWLVGGVLMVVLVVLSRTVTRPGGYVAGSVAQALVLAAGVVVPMMVVLGGVFVLMWVVALRLGGRIDRERAEWDAAHPGELGV
jgi:hypothetical protein